VNVVSNAEVVNVVELLEACVGRIEVIARDVDVCERQWEMMFLSFDSKASDRKGETELVTCVISL
jgi:hypothetical protein